MVDLTKLSDEELESISAGNLKNLSEDTLRLISGVQAPAGAVPPSAIKSGPETAEKFQAEADAKRAAIVQGFEESSKKDASTNPMTAEGILSSNIPLVTGAALLTLGTGYVAGRYGPQIAEKAKGAYKSVKERFMASPVEPIKIDPIGFESFADMTPATQAPNPLGQTNMTLEDIERLRASQIKPAETPPAPGPIARTPLPTGAVNPAMFSSSPKAPVPPGQPPMTPFTPDELAAVFRGEAISTPITSAPLDSPAPTPTFGPGSPTTTIVNDTVKEMIQETPDPTKSQELRTGTGKPAFAGMGPVAALNKKGQPKLLPEYADINAVPSDMAFVPGAQYIDPGRQDMGQSLFTKTYSAQDYPSTDQMARQQAAEINRMLNRPTRAELKAAGLEPAPNTPGITKKTSAGTKPVRVAGTLGALIAIPDLAKAETVGQRGMAGANLLEAVLPPGFMMSGAGEGSSTVPNADAAMLLGSPYAQSELAKKRRQALEYAAKVGGGRGLTPASAYQR